MSRCADPPCVHRAIYALCRALAAPALTTLTGVRHFNVPRVRGMGGLLIAANHQSYLDPVLVGVALDRPIHYLARHDLFEVPGLGPLIRAVNTHPLRQNEVDGTAVRTVLRILRAGEALLLFPEGTRTWDGSIGRFQVGVGAIAARCGVPVLPVCIEGTFRCWPRSRTLPLPARVAVAFGEFLWPERRDARRLTREVAEQVAGLQRFLCRYLGRPSVEQQERS